MAIILFSKMHSSSALKRANDHEVDHSLLNLYTMKYIATHQPPIDKIFKNIDSSKVLAFWVESTNIQTQTQMKNPIPIRKAACVQSTYFIVLLKNWNEFIKIKRRKYIEQHSQNAFSIK